MTDPTQPSAPSAPTAPTATTADTTAAELDFERAQFDTELGPRICNVCGAPITDSYYTHASTTICPRCQPNYTAKLGQSSFATALLYGLAAGAGSAVVWYLIREWTGSELGLIAIGLGIAVGLAVRKGAGASSSKLYRVLAVVIAYWAMVSTYVPLFVEQMRADNPELASGGLALAIAYVFAFGIALISPYFMLMDGGAMGVIIIGIGLWEAWRLSAPRAEDQLAGPFQIQTAA